jgi:hypothetical protein
MGLKWVENWKIRRHRQQRAEKRMFARTSPDDKVSSARRSGGGGGSHSIQDENQDAVDDDDDEDSPAVSVGEEAEERSFLYRHFGITPSEVSDAIYGSLGAFTSATNVEATNTPQKMLNIGFTFFLVIILASYTANLASNLISHDTSTPFIADMDDANTRALSICVAAGTAAETTISASYPRINVVPIDTAIPSGVLAPVADGTCAGAVVFKYEWDTRQNYNAANPYCNLVAVDYDIRPFSGAWCVDNSS